MLLDHWEISLFGGLTIRQGAHTVDRFRTHKGAVLLAYLAYYGTRSHSRDTMIEILWPDTDVDVARNRMRVELTLLRRQLEPYGMRSVLEADRKTVRLHPEAFRADVAQFESELEEARRTASDEARIEALTRAAGLYRGDLLAGWDEEWILPERERLFETHLGALRRLVRLHTSQKQWDQGIAYAQQAVKADPFREESVRDLMQLYAATGRQSAALTQYRDLEGRLRAELDAMPSAELQRLAAQLETTLGHGMGASRPETAPVESPAVERPSPTPAPEAPRRDSLRQRMPIFLTRFFGREEAVDALCALASDGHSRLITLTGPGGTGKTRLVTEVASLLGKAFRGGIWFVPLADCVEPGLVPSAIADALGLVQEAQRDALTQIQTRLMAADGAQDGETPKLMILDNFEQLVRGGSEIVAELLERCPSLTCLVTSRRSLGIPGEREYPVRPLEVPAEEEATTDFTAPPVAAIQLFMDRAQAVSPDFRRTPRNAPDIAAICRRLDGIPLAIELAASRIRVLAPAQMRERLTERFELLVNRRADKEARHRSLWAAIDWSYNLLSPGMRRFFAALSVFRGGFTLEAATAVAADPARNDGFLSSFPILDALEQLRVDSLLIAEESEGAMRFRMLETLREFGQEQMPPGEREAIRRRHAIHFLELAEEANRRLLTSEEVVWLHRMEEERDNLRTAMEWAREADGEAELRLAAAHRWYYVLSSRLREGRERLEGCLQAHRDADVTPQVWGNALNALGMIACYQDDFEAAEAPLQQAKAIMEGLGNEWEATSSEMFLGWVARHRSAEAEARTRLLRAAAVFRRLNDAWMEGGALNFLGYVTCSSEDYAAAIQYFRASLAAFERLGDIVPSAYCPLGLARVAWKQGRYSDSWLYYEQALAAFMRHGDYRGMTYALAGCARLANAEGDPARAAAFFGRAERLRAEIGMVMDALSLQEQQAIEDAVRSALGEEAFRTAWEQGRQLTLEEIRAYAQQPSLAPRDIKIPFSQIGRRGFRG